MADDMRTCMSAAHSKKVQGTEYFMEGRYRADSALALRMQYAADVRYTCADLLRRNNIFDMEENFQRIYYFSVDYCAWLLRLQLLLKCSFRRAFADDSGK